MQQQFNKIQQFCFDRLSKTLEAAPPYLFHYTTASSMRKIFENEVLWAHSVEGLNDYAEVRYGASVLRAHLNRRYSLSKDFSSRELLGFCRQNMDGVDFSTVFVNSFSADGNEEGMWRLYADDGRGFSFSVETSALATSHNGFLSQCEYEPAQLDDFCSCFLAEAERDFLAAKASGISVAEYSMRLFEEVRWFMPTFKPHAWRDEKEWRMFYLAAKNTSHLRSDGRRYVVSPEKLKIKGICAGPKCSDADVAWMAEAIAKSSNPTLPLRKSTIAFED